MTGLENAIRNALARAERGDPEARARIYQSARNALETGLRKQGIDDAETVAAQRHRLELTIHQIEAEERVASTSAAGLGEREPARPSSARREEPPAVEPVVPRQDADLRREAGRPADDDITDIRPSREDGLRGAMSVGEPEPARKPRRAARRGDDLRPERVAKAPRRRNRFVSFLLVVVTLAVVLGIVAWWAHSSGLLRALQQDGDSNAPETLAEEGFDGPDPLKEALDAQSNFTSDWRQIFDPSDMSVLSASAEGRFEPVSTNDGPAARLTSAAPERDGAVRIEVKPDVLQEMSGKRSTIALTLQSVSGKPVQVSVECAFASLGECGRHRFTVAARTDILFQVEFDRSLSPTEPGHLLVNSDVGGGGASVNLFGARILPGE